MFLILLVLFAKSLVFGLELDSSDPLALSPKKSESSEVLFKRILLKINSGERVPEKFFDALVLCKGHFLKASWVRKVIVTKNCYLVSAGAQLFSSEVPEQYERAFVGSKVLLETEKLKIEAKKRETTLESLRLYLKIGLWTKNK